MNAQNTENGLKVHADNEAILLTHIKGVKSHPEHI